MTQNGINELDLHGFENRSRSSLVKEIVPVTFTIINRRFTSMKIDNNAVRCS